MHHEAKNVAHAARASADAPVFLTAPLQLLVDTHATLNPDAPSVLDEPDVVGGVFLETVEPAVIGEGAWSQTLAAIDAAERDDGAHRSAAARGGDALQEVLDLPEPARDSALDALGRGAWTSAGRGIRVLELARDGASKAELLRIEPGCGAPAHGHGGGEYTLVLTGAFRDGDRVFRRGELCAVGAEDVHRPVAEPGDVCYALAVTDAPLEFRGMLGLLQKVMGRA